MGIRHRQLVMAALALNAARPVPGYRAAVPAFAAGWLTGELAPHLLALTTLDLVTHAARPRRDAVGLALGGLAAAGLAHAVLESLRARGASEAALLEAGPDGAAPTLAPVSHLGRGARRRDLLWPFTSPVRGLDVERDVAYSDAGRRGRLDVYRASSAAPSVRGPGRTGAPVLVQVHGGAWMFGDKSRQALPLMRHLADRGWVCVALNYRVAPRDPFPAQLVDVKRVLAWVQEHIADYGGDPSYVAITGGSAGGHLATLAALTAGDPAWQPGFEEADTSVSAAVPLYGVYDLAGVSGSRRSVALRDRFWGPKIAQRRYADDPRAFEDATPLLQVGADAPAFFVLHGDRDSLVPVDQARDLVRRLRAATARPVLYAELPGAQHAFDGFTSLRSTQVVRAVEAFLRWHAGPGDQARARGTS